MITFKEYYQVIEEGGAYAEYGISLMSEVMPMMNLGGSDIEVIQINVESSFDIGFGDQIVLDFNVGSIANHPLF